MFKSTKVDAIEGKISKNILLFALPLMLSSILQLLYNAADIVVVGRFAGHESLAAVGSTSSLINLIVNFFIGLSIGVNVIIARYIGAKDTKNCHRALHTSATVALISGLVAAIIGFFVSRPALELMDSPADVIDKATLYLKIYFIGTPANVIYNFGSAVLRANGDTTRPLMFLSLSGLVNVVLNLITVIYFDMGVAGVAIATIASQYLSAILVVASLKKGAGPCVLHFSSMCFDKKEFFEILRLGIPAAIQSSLFSISNVIIQSGINSFDDSMIVAGNAAGSNVEGFVYCLPNAIYHAVMTFISQNIGAKKIQRIVPILKRGLLIAFIISFSASLIVMALDEPLLSIYSKDAPAIEAGIVRLSIIVPTYFLCGLMEVTSGALRGIGYSLLPMITSVMGACVFRIAWVYTIFAKWHTMDVLFFSYPISWILVLSANLIFFAIVFPKVKKRFTTENTLL